MGIKQGLTNFIGGVNDTMNMPAVAIGQVGEWLSPKGSKAETEFRNFKNTAKGVSDIGQDYQSAGYMIGRMAPGAAVFGALPAAGALPGAAVAGVEAAGLGTLSTIPEMQYNNMNGGQSTRGLYRIWRKKGQPNEVIMQKKQPIQYKGQPNEVIMQKRQPIQYKGNISL